MSATQFGTNDPRTQKKWSRKMFEYALDDFFFLNRGFLGADSNSIIQVVSELEGNHNKGDALTVELEVPLSDTGQGDGGTVTGNEEDMIVLNQTVNIHERAHGVVSNGPLDEKRTAGNFRERGKRQLGTWWRNVCLEADIWRSVYGLYNDTGISTVNELAPSTNRILYIGESAAGSVGTAQASDAALSSQTAANYLCGLNVLSLMKRKAQMATPKIRPIKVKGYDKAVYIAILHPYQIKAIKAQTGETGYASLMKAAEIRGKENPLFAGAEFLYDGILVYEYDRAPMRTGAGGTTPSEGFVLNAGKTATTDAVASGKSVARGLLLGAQAGMMVWGRRPSWYEDKVDARKPQIVTDALYATSKVVFNEYTQPSGPNTAQEDYGVYAFDTQVVVD